MLMLGTFPPPRARWSVDFYYPNFQNDMWRIFGLAFFGDKDRFVEGRRFDKEKIADFCSEKGIALSDTALEVVRLKGNASDKFLEITRPADIRGMLRRLPECRAVAVTGQKASETFASIFDIEEPKVGSFTPFTFECRAIKLYRMPSSSRAYPKPLAEKAAVYREMFGEIGLL